MLADPLTTGFLFPRTIARELQRISAMLEGNGRPEAPPSSLGGSSPALALSA